jgi:hypothetical protein
MFGTLYATGLSEHRGIVPEISESFTPPVRRSPMHGNYSVSAWAVLLTVTIIVGCLVAAPAEAYRVCTFKGTVVDNGWRTMSVKSGGQCAEVNVGWRTKYIPNRRPCLGERIAVDFILEDGFMKATKVVSLSPLPREAECYPPAPPSTSVCRTAGEETTAVDTCPSPRAICATRPPAHVADKNWSPSKKVITPKAPTPPTAKKPSEERKEIAKAPVTKTAPEGKEEPKEGIPTEEKKHKTISGEVVASSPKSLSIRVTQEGEAAEVMNVKVGLKTKFIPFRRPAVGEKVKVEYRQENGDKFGYTVQVVQ